MDDLGKYKYKIEKDIVDKALIEYTEERLSRDELKKIADFTSDAMGKIKSRQDLASFLNALTGYWPFFKTIAIIDQGEYKEEVEGEVYSEALHMAKDGNIDNAIKLAKTMTN